MSSLSFSNKVAMTASKNIPFQFFAECKLLEKNNSKSAFVAAEVLQGSRAQGKYPILPNATFLYPWNHQNTLQFSEVFSGCRKVTLATNGINCLVAIKRNNSENTYLVIYPNKWSPKGKTKSEFDWKSHAWHIACALWAACGSSPEMQIFAYIRGVFNQPAITCSKLKIKTLKHSHLALVFLLITLNR